MPTISYSHKTDDPLNTSLPVLLLAHFEESVWKQSRHLRDHLEYLHGYTFNQRHISATLTALANPKLSTLDENGLRVSFAMLEKDGNTSGSRYRRTPLGTLALEYVRSQFAPTM